MTARAIRQSRASPSIFQGDTYGNGHGAGGLCGPFNSHSLKAGCFLQFTDARSVSQTAAFGSLRDGNDRKNFGFY
jgi:hypothetical protein